MERENQGKGYVAPTGLKFFCDGELQIFRAYGAGTGRRLGWSKNAAVTHRRYNYSSEEVYFLRRAGPK
jgi:hypothetical protein